MPSHLATAKFHANNKWLQQLILIKYLTLYHENEYNKKIRGKSYEQRLYIHLTYI